MLGISKTLQGWSKDHEAPAKLNQNQSLAVHILAAVFLAMAVLQLASFNEFKSILTSLGLTGSPETWAAAVILAEVWAALGFIGVRMPGLLRGFGRMFAVLVSGFWFLTSLQAVTGSETVVSNMGFFGKYLSQTPGWWTVIEATVLALWTLYAIEITKKK